MRNVVIFCLLFWVIPFSVAYDETEFKVSFGSQNAPPYAIIENNELVGGIIRDIVLEIAAELNINVSFHYIPKKRTSGYLMTNKIHAVIISNPKWLEQSERFSWSIPLFKEQDVLVLNQSMLDIQNFDDLLGKTFGTIRGYYYPTIDSLFETDQIQRSDVSHLNLNFTRLEKGWIDAVVDSKILIDYYFSQHPEHHFKLASLVVSEHNVHTAISPQSPVSVEQFNLAFEKLKQHGVIDAILNKYRLDGDIIH